MAAQAMCSIIFPAALMEYFSTNWNTKGNYEAKQEVRKSEVSGRGLDVVCKHRKDRGYNLWF